MKNNIKPVHIHFEELFVSAIVCVFFFLFSFTLLHFERRKRFLITIVFENNLWVVIAFRWNYKVFLFLLLNKGTNFIKALRKWFSFLFFFESWILSTIKIHLLLSSWSFQRLLNWIINVIYWRILIYCQKAIAFNYFFVGKNVHFSDELSKLLNLILLLLWNDRVSILHRWYTILLLNRILTVTLYRMKNVCHRHRLYL